MAFTVWLADATTGQTATLVEDFENSFWSAYFSDHGGLAYVIDHKDANQATIQFGLDGSEQMRATKEAFCAALVDDSNFAAQSFERIGCFSRGQGPPGGSWFLTRENRGELEYATWGENSETGERFLLVEGMNDCGGCDAVFGQRWSPSGRYVVFPETDRQVGGRVFLTDFVTRETRQISVGNQIGEAPQWSPIEDVLLLASESGSVIREDFVAGTRSELGHLEWPARFDASGAYIYSPAFSDPHPEKSPDSLETVVAWSDTGAAVAMLSGASPGLNLWRYLEPVAGRGEGFIAALEQANGCDGTTVYVDSNRVGCVSDAVGAVISPDGSKVALARVTGSLTWRSFLAAEPSTCRPTTSSSSTWRRRRKPSWRKTRRATSLPSSPGTPRPATC